MKTLLLIILCWLPIHVAWGSHAAEVTKVQRKINEMTYKAIEKKLNLEGTQKIRVFEILKSYDAKKAEEYDKLFHYNEELRTLETKPDTSKFMKADVIRRIKKCRFHLSQIEEEKTVKLRELLSQDQISSYFILTQEVDDQVLNAVREELKKEKSDHKH